MSKPNIVLLLTDQQRQDSLGCYGADWISTPNLDRLASEGVRFDRCYCTNAICTPSRASLWTGKHLPGHGVYRLDDILPDTEILFTEHLRQAGYRTGLFGKLHVSGRRFEDEQRNANDGFDEYEWSLEGPLNMDAPMQAYSKWLKEQNPDVHADMRRLGRDLLHVPRELHFTRWAADRSIDFIERNAGKQPFFCCMSVFDPHNPYENYPKEYADRVDATRLPAPITDERTDISMNVERERKHSYLGDIDAFSPEDIERMRIGYFASIALIDDEIGRIIDALEKTGALDNTLIIFASDHGDMLGDHRLLVKGAVFYDACVRVPLIIRWPKKLFPPTDEAESPARSLHASISAPVQLHDVAATVLAAAGVERPWTVAESDITGQDLLPLATGRIDSVREDTVNLYRDTGINRHTRNWDPELHASMILNDRYKLSVYHGDSEGRPKGELYDMVDDPDEMKNLWSDPSSVHIRLDLEERLIDWLVKHETTYLGSRGGTATVRPEEFVSNTIDRNR